MVVEYHVYQGLQNLILYSNKYTFIVMHFNMTEGFEFLFEALSLVDRGHVKSEEARLERDLESTYACENNIRM
jgi:hypothetical protein